MIFLLHQLIEDAAARDAEHAALVCRDERITYGELFERSRSLANYLVDLGVATSDRVGILLNKSLESGVGLYGVMAAGAAYVPLDSTAPAARLAYLIQDCGIRHVISEPRKAPVFAALHELGIELDTVIGITNGKIPYRSVAWNDIPTNTRRPPTGVTEQDLSYILYTSGSTGVPKGIMHTHRSALSWANVSASAYSIDGSDIISNYAPLQFDLSTLDFFAGARGGATTVMIPEEHMKLPASLAGLIESERLTLIFTVPMALIQLSKPGVLDDRDLSSLERILFGGEPMPLKHLRALMERLPHTQFFNVYGPTEVNGCTHHQVDFSTDLDRDSLPIGLPYDNVEALVIDSVDQPVSTGEVGELAIRAPTMMRGYWGRPDLNATAFYFRDTFSGLSDVFHKTGDLVHRGPEGAFYFHGRKDRQVKSRGYRVELDEVEAVLIAHPEVKEAAVFSISSEEETALIHATVTLSGNGSAGSATLRSFMGDSLPAYAVPSSFTIREDFPRTTSGKIDRIALAAETQRQVATLEKQ